MNEKINSGVSVELLGIDNDNKLTFHNHIPTLCRRRRVISLMPSVGCKGAKALRKKKF